MQKRKLTAIGITVLILVVLDVIFLPRDKPGSNFTPTIPVVTQKLTLPGCSNLYKVTDVLYRGAQPNAEGFKQLQKLGMKTVVNLRQHHSDRDELKGTHLNYIHIKMQAWDPEYKEIQQVLKTFIDPEKQPVFVHCQHGADRTGTMIACYRVVIQGWTKQKAIEEMTKGGYNYHKVWKMLPEFIEELDVEKMRKDLGIETPPPKEIE